MKDYNTLYDLFKERWPDLFSDVRSGFYLPKGWATLVYLLCLDLEKIGLNEESRVQQVKSKFGTLMFYTNFTTGLYADIIHFYESLSGHVCPHCSSANVVNYQNEYGIINIVCEECIEKKNI